MNCKDIQDLISSYIDDACTQQEKDWIEKHFEQCDDCLEVYLLTKDLVERLKSFDELEVPEHFHEDLMSKIQHHDQMLPKKHKKYFKSFKGYSTIAASFLFLFLFGILGTQYFLNNNENGSDSTTMEAPQMLMESSVDEAVESEFNNSETALVEPNYSLAGEDTQTGDAPADTGVTGLTSPDALTIEDDSKDGLENEAIVTKAADGLVGEEGVAVTEEVVDSKGDSKITYGEASDDTQEIAPLESSAADRSANQTADEALKTPVIWVVVLVILVFLILGTVLRQNMRRHRK